MDNDRLAGSANNVFGKVESAVGKAVGDSKTEAAGFSREAQGAVQNAFGQAKDAARDIGNSASKIAGNAIDAGQSMVRTGSDSIADNIQNRPGSALLTAGIIGFALGIIIAKGSQPARPRRVWDRYS
jgi:uncharacterized protein YjbJ (UPF0337 family)